MPASYLDIEAIVRNARKSLTWGVTAAFVPVAYMLALFVGGLIGYWINPTYDGIFTGVLLQAILLPICGVASIIMLLRGAIIGVRCWRTILRAAIVSIIATLASFGAAILLSWLAVIAIDS